MNGPSFKSLKSNRQFKRRVSTVATLKSNLIRKAQTLHETNTPQDAIEENENENENENAVSASKKDLEDSDHDSDYKDAVKHV